MKNILIYDDNTEEMQQLKNILLQLIVEEDVEIYTAENAKNAEELIDNEICFLIQDIELSDNENGIDFAIRMQKQYPTLKLVFITAHTKYYEEMFRAEPCGFISKPFTKETVKRSIGFIADKFANKGTFNYSVTKGKIQKIPYDDISYIESYMKKVKIHNVKGEVIAQYRDTISGIKPKLPAIFVRCHQGFLVNLKYIKELSRKGIILSNGHEISISQKYFLFVKDSFTQYIGSKIV